MSDALKIKTSRFGELEVDEQSVVSIMGGVLGFPKETKYVLLEYNPPFSWLQSIENADLAFVVVNAAAPAVTEATGEALAGKVVGVQQGNIADLWVSNADNTVPGEVMRYTKFAQAGEDLKNSKIDCIVMDELPAKELVESSNGALTILEGDPLFVDQYAIAVQKGNSEMLDVVNSVIKELQDNGKMDEIIASHSQAK